MPHWKLTLSYDGTTFHGWQVQPGLATIQGTLSDTLFHLTGERVLPQGSGRTDAGVHALAQVASFSLAAPIPAPNLLRALNRSLPPSIRILDATQVPEHFHARHSVLRKTYEYRLFERHPATLGPDAPDRICLPFLAPYVWDVRWPLDLEAMQQASTHLLGTHDFTSFAAADPDRNQRASDGSEPKDLSSQPKHRASAMRSAETSVFADASAATASAPNPTKTIHTSTFIAENDLLIYRITGSGFLHHMVRNLVGTLADIGRGALTPTDIPRILAARNRSAAGPTAPATGLFLAAVEYRGDAP